MTARPQRAVQRPGRIRVIGGKARIRRPAFSPFVLFGIVIIASMIGIVVARTSLDSGAFRIAELEASIQAEERRNELLTLQVARLESPTRIGPLAQEMGMVPASDRTMLVVAGPSGGDPGAFDGSRLAMGSSETLTAGEAAPEGGE